MQRSFGYCIFIGSPGHLQRLSRSPENTTTSDFQYWLSIESLVVLYKNKNLGTHLRFLYSKYGEGSEKRVWKKSHGKFCYAAGVGNICLSLSMEWLLKFRGNNSMQGQVWSRGSSSYHPHKTVSHTVVNWDCLLNPLYIQWQYSFQDDD